MSRITISRRVRVVSLFPLVLCLVGGYVSIRYFGMPVRPWLALAGGFFAVAAIILGNPWFTYEDGAPSKLTTLLRVNAGLGLATLGIIVTADVAGFVGNGTPAPTTRITDPLNQAPALLQYAATLDFDTTFHAMDEDFLEVGQAGQFDSIIGPRARVYPERSSHLNSPKDLGAGAGRIVARFEVEADPRRGGIGHAKLRLPVGVSYLWVDNVADDGTIRAIIVSSSGAVVVPRSTRHELGYGVARAQAQFQFDPADPCVCESCMLHGWCRVCGN